MPTVTANAPAVVSIDGAKRLEKSAKLAAALLPNIVAAAEALEVARTLGKSDQEFFGEIVQVAKAERSPRMLAIELLDQGMTGAEVARRTGFTSSRIYQLKKENSKELRRAVKRILDFLDANDAPDDVCDAINMIATPAARKMFEKVSGEE